MYVSKSTYVIFQLHDLKTGQTKLDHGGESRDIFTYIRAERVRTLIIIYLILNEFSCGKVQILCLFSSKSFDKSRFHARCIFPHKLEQSLKVFAQACMEKYIA